MSPHATHAAGWLSPLLCCSLQVAELPTLLEQLQHCNAQLEVVERGLNDLLDMKKMAFPRFFFLSNDELLEILSEAKDPLNIQPFVKKCFEAVKEFIFAPNGDITGMISVEGGWSRRARERWWVELLCPNAGIHLHTGGLWSLCSDVETLNGALPSITSCSFSGVPRSHGCMGACTSDMCPAPAGEKVDWLEPVKPEITGAVELWLNEVEGVIRRTVHKLAEEALTAYAVTERSKWILEWPGQLVLNCSQVGAAGCVRQPGPSKCVLFMDGKAALHLECVPCIWIFGAGAQPKYTAKHPLRLPYRCSGQRKWLGPSMRGGPRA